MTASVNSRSSKQQLIDYAKNELGIELPESMNNKEMYEHIKAAQGITTDDDDVDQGVNDDTNDTQTQQVAATDAGDLQVVAEQKAPTHFTIRVTKPAGTQMADMVITANGVNTQLQFGKDVKVSAAAYHALNDAVELIPAHRDPDSGELIGEKYEPRYNFMVVKEHFE